MMVYNEERFQQLLNEAMRCINAPENCAAYLEGSIAEGFGNEKSDIDFIVLVDGDQEFPPLPILLYIEGQRIEIRIRSSGEMQQMAREIFESARGGRRGLTQLSEEVLDKFQRFSHSLPLRNHALLNSLHDLLPTDELAKVISAWFNEHALQSMRCAVAMLALGQQLEAANWARSGLNQGVRSWLATRGETYIDRTNKWFFQQLGRVKGDDEIRERALLLESPARSGLDLDTYVRHVAQFLEAIGITGCCIDPSKASLRRRAGVTTWQIGSRVHVVSQWRELFGLNKEAARAWRTLPFKRPLPEVLKCVDAHPGIVGNLVAEFHRLGLVSLHWQGGGEIKVRAASPVPPSTQQPILSLGGVIFSDDEDMPFKLVQLSPQRFAAAGAACGWANMEIENAREDAVGALKAKQWGVFERAARRMLKETCAAALSAYGVNPLPPNEEIVLRLQSVEMPSSDIKTKILELDQQLLVDNEETASSMLESVNKIVLQMRDLTKSHMPSCFDSSDAWQETITIGYEWACLAVHLRAKIPKAMLKLVALGGQQPGFNTSRSR